MRSPANTSSWSIRTATPPPWRAWQDARNRHVFRTVNGFSAALDKSQVRALRESARVAYVGARPRRHRVCDPDHGCRRQPVGPGQDRRAAVAAVAQLHVLAARRGRDGVHHRHRPHPPIPISAAGRRRIRRARRHGRGLQRSRHARGRDDRRHHLRRRQVRPLRGVRVLNCTGSGSTSGIIRGARLGRPNAGARRSRTCRLGGGRSTSLNTATANLANSGMFIAVAAGNESQNACNVRRPRPGGLHAAASDKTDRRASFSNYGSCVDGYAPGVGIKSAWLGTGTATISGTSMASPHAAGVGALYKSSSATPRRRRSGPGSTRTRRPA